MNESDYTSERFRRALHANAGIFEIAISEEQSAQLVVYYNLLQTWNARLHLVAPCAPEEFAVRHVLESIYIARYFMPRARVTDIGSGGGLPAIPCLIARPDIFLTLIESSAKKHIFLTEAIRTVAPRSPTRIITFRFEKTVLPPQDFYTCRALDKFTEKLPPLYAWANAGATLLLMAGEEVEKVLQREQIVYEKVLLPASEKRFLFIIKK